MNPADPKDLIRESYRIDGITPAECRTIFLDWALSLASGADTARAAAQLLETYGRAAPDHPMTHILHEVKGAATVPRRRGGWRARQRD